MSDKPHYHGHRERLRERLVREPRSLADYEILELLLGHVVRRGDTKPLAKELLTTFGTLRGVFEAQEAELLDVPGFGPSLAGFWALWRETWSRLHEAPLRERAVLSGPEQVAALAKARLGPSRTEEFWLALVDSKNRLLAWERLSRGTVDRTPVYPREVLALALKHQAAGVILVHNHPGGDPKPSSDDIETTRRIARVALEMGLRLLDHLVVAEAGWYSFEQQGML
ncbi:DNA repair protein radc [Desulfocurvibacter africanus PCS]|uniref:DNA repair protein radc n=2 Tax=Desulfocurvibacter africanus TaxID=873 RepID=M5PSF1_DESAF|nr:DNA repair protein RadC [Desulfocurvibacter africanus]EMG37044.1 DNA repair protein radc [Desulfocurvibacter africanus PCS]